MGEGEEGKSLFDRMVKRLLDVQNNPQYLILLLGVLVLFGLGYGLFNSNGEFLYALRSTEISRGLITFLVAVTTVSIAILAALYAIASNLPPEQIKERFGFAKEILTTLVGILGTVLGFYFGSADNVGTKPLVLAETQFRSGQLLTHVSGGSEPYRYTIVYPSQDPKSKVTKITKDGWIIEQLTPSPVKAEVISIEILDSKEQRLSKAVPFAEADSLAPKPASVTSPTNEMKPPVATSAPPATPASPPSTPAK